MSKREIVEDSIVAIIIVSVFSGIFSVTYAFQNDIQQNSIVTEPVLVQPTPHAAVPELKVVTPTPATLVQITEETKTPDVDSSPIEKEKVEAEEIVPAVVPIPVVFTKTVVQDTEPVITRVVTSPSQPNNNSEYIDELASLIEQRTNAFRKKNRLPALLADSNLERSSTLYSKLMLKEDFFSHTDNNGCDMTCRFKANGYKAQTWGENLAKMSFDELPTAEVVADYFMEGWEKSAGHRENLLSDAFTHQGIGVAMSNGAIYVTVDFAKPLQ